LVVVSNGIGIAAKDRFFTRIVVLRVMPFKTTNDLLFVGLNYFLEDDE